MIWFLTKTLVSALLIATISEIARRYPLVAAALASLPLVSILAFIWIRIEGANDAAIGALSTDIFWLVLPSLALFLLLPILLNAGVSFWVALPLSCVAMAGLYALMLGVLAR